MMYVLPPYKNEYLGSVLGDFEGEYLCEFFLMLISRLFMELMMKNYV